MSPVRNSMSQVCKCAQAETGIFKSQGFLLAMVLGLLVADRPLISVVIAQDAPVDQTQSAEIQSEQQLEELHSKKNSPLPDPFEDALDPPEQSIDSSERKLSVGPSSKLQVLPDDRPNWVGTAVDLSTKFHRIPVGSSPELTREAAEKSIDEAMLAAITNYLDTQIYGGEQIAKHTPLSVPFVRKNLLVDGEGYMAELKTSSGPMFQKWVMLVVSPEQQALFDQWRVEALQRRRVGTLGIGLLALLGGTSGVHLFLARRAGAKSGPQTAAENASLQAVAIPHKRTFMHKVSVAGGLLLVASAFAFATNSVPIEKKPRDDYRERRIVDHKAPGEPSGPRVSESLTAVKHVPGKGKRPLGKPRHRE